MNKRLRALFLSGLLTVTGASLFSVFTAGTASGTTLYAGIEHASYLQPVEDEHANTMNQHYQAQASQYNLRAQQQQAPQPQFESPQDGHYDQYHSVPRLTGNANVVQNVGPTVEWFMIPKWMAGAWQKQGDLTVSYRDLRSGRFTSMSAWTENVMRSTWGHQTDRMGNVWHADILPLEKDGWSKGKLARFMMTNMNCEHSSQQQLVTRARYVVTETYGGTAQVADMFQQESLNDYTLMGDGELENMSSNRIYSSQGQPLREGALVSKLQKVGPFQPVPYQNNIDLAQSLNTYLNSHGLQHLANTPQTSSLPQPNDLD